MTKTAGLYGGSLYGLAAEENLTEEFAEELAGVERIFRENPDYIRLLSEPSVPGQERLGLIDAAFGGQVHEYILHFLKILCEKGMLRDFYACCREFRRSYNEDHGLVEAVVTSAVELTPAQLAALRERLEKISGKKVALTQKTDSRVLGGLRVEFNGTQYDGTLAGRLGALRKDITKSIV